MEYLIWLVASAGVIAGVVAGNFLLEKWYYKKHERKLLLKRLEEV